MNDLTTSPPADLEAEVPAIVSWARGLRINDAESFTEAGEGLKRIKGAHKRAEEFFNPLLASTYEAHKAALSAKKKITGPLTEAESMAKRAMLSYQLAERQKAEIERQKLQAIADEQARRDREALEKKAAAAKKPETKQRYAEAATAVLAPVVHVQTEAPAVSGISTVKRWTFRVTDAASVPREFLVVDEKKLGAYARAMREGATCAGVEFFAEENLSSRGT